MMETTLTQRIKSKALELGFSEIGIAQAVPLAKEAVHLTEWLEKKYNAGMQWMEREKEKRTNPYLIFPQVKSIVCVAMNYYSPEMHSENSDTGKISRYAWGDDYHIIMTELLGELLGFINSEIPEIKGRIYVDTGPMMDKVWAVRAGIGWMGKHSNVITRKFCSWVFLGEILLDIELDYDKPIMDLCGTCTACIDACPTKAIVKPYVLDSSRCISYLTIEHRDVLPKDLLCEFHHWVYGCDICQDVCPWNRFQKKTEVKAFYPRQENIAPKLTELAEMSQEEFTRRFHHSPIKRAKQTGLTRNAKGVLESMESSK
jgi:epoxyqueuosine reductase